MYKPEPRRRHWPLTRPRRNRCRAWFYENNEVIECNKLFWPWQDIVREWDPECGGPYLHHECHHREVRTRYAEECVGRGNEDYWMTWLDCEHRTERA